MPLMEEVRKGEFLGREFLLWIWFKADMGEGRFDLDEPGPVEMWVDRKIVLQSEGDEGVEKITCSGYNPYMREARFALTGNKKITEAIIRLAVGDNEWSFTLDSTWLNLKSLKTPKVTQDRDEDPDGLFYDKVFLIEQALSAVDGVYACFIRLRLSPDWEETERPRLLDWISKGRISDPRKSRR